MYAQKEWQRFIWYWHMIGFDFREGVPRNESGATHCGRNDIGCDGRKGNTVGDGRQKRRQRKDERQKRTEDGNGWKNRCTKLEKKEFFPFLQRVVVFLFPFILL